VTYAEKLLFLSVALAIITFGDLAIVTFPARSASLGDFLKAHPECREINDGCSVCRVVNGKAFCSTPGIACIIKGWQCSGGTLQPISDKLPKTSDHQLR
jgi:hypothetical protein